MKTIYNKLLVGLLMVALSFTMANSPLNAQKVAKGINYQAVLRDSENKFIADKNIKVTISIFKKEINGELVWEETHNPTTNKVGIFTLVIGQGTRIKGYVSKFSDIRWGTEEHLLKVVAEVDGRTIDFPASPMLSVPYAFFADSARVARADFSGVAFDPVSNTLKNSNAVIADLSPLRQSLEYDPASYHLSISGKPGIVDLRQFAHSPQDLRILNNKLWITGNKDSTVVDLSPYKQTLQISATSKLQISGGNEVQVDTSNVNEIQTLSLNGNKVGLSKSGGEVTIDPSETNELQTISLTGNKLALNKSGGEVTIDASETNEIQDLNLTDNIIKITNNPTAKAIDLSKYLDNTDKQTLSRGGNNLIISGGNQVDVSDMINMQWTGFSGNNLSTQALPGLTETIISWNEEFDSGNVLDNNRFTAPAKGIYNLSFSLILSTDNRPIRIYKNGVLFRSFEEFGKTFSHTMLLQLEMNDVILIQIHNSSATPVYINSGYFSGFRVN